MVAILSSKTKGDKVIWALVVLLALVSLLAVYSATGSLAYKNYKGNTEVYLFKQIALSLLVCWLFILPTWSIILFIQEWQRSYSCYLFLLLIYTLFFGVSMNEGSRWIDCR